MRGMWADRSLACCSNHLSPLCVVQMKYRNDLIKRLEDLIASLDGTSKASKPSHALQLATDIAEFGAQNRYPACPFGTVDELSPEFRAEFISAMKPVEGKLQGIVARTHLSASMALISMPHEQHAANAIVQSTTFVVAQYVKLLAWRRRQAELN